MSANEEVRFDVAGHVARVTIDRPKVLNALDAKAESRLEEIWDGIESDPEIWVVVLSGAGDRAFCTGSDMSATKDTRTGLEYWAAASPNGFGGLSLRDSLNVPVIARVNGYCLGGGLEMVLGCDLVVAADHAEFGLTEPRVGRVPLEGGVALLNRRISHTAAMGLLLTGRRASATEMAQFGLLNEVVPATSLDGAVDKWVQRVLACAPTSLRAIKQWVQRTSHLPPREAQALRLSEVVGALNSANAVEGVRAFRERRAPRWTSR